MLPALRDRAANAERLRRLPDETVKDFQEAGLFRALQPQRYGGYELDPGTFYQAVMDMGTVCGSSAWILGVVGIHNWQLGLFHPQAQEDVWHNDTSTLLSTSLAPTGTVERVDGGFRLHGRWSFSSGCDFCQWVVLGGIVPPQGEGEPPDPRTFLVPRSAYTIDDNWYVMGLCGTGSKDIVVEDAVVPEYRTLSYHDMFYLRYPGTEVNETPSIASPLAVSFPVPLPPRQWVRPSARCRPFGNRRRPAYQHATIYAWRKTPSSSSVWRRPPQKWMPRRTGCCATVRR